MGLTFSGMVLNLNGISIVSRPNAPIVGTATAIDSTTATVDFIAPKYNGGGTITSYTAVSNPGGITGTVSQSGSGTITVLGLPGGTSYTFTVYATNSEGNSDSSGESNQITTGPPAAPDQVAYTTSGTYSWVCPAGVTSVSVVAIGGGGGGSWGQGYNGISLAGAGGGGLGYKNNIPVVPGESYTVVVGVGGTGGLYGGGGAGGDSYFINTSTVKGGGAVSNGLFRSTETAAAIGALGGTYVGDGGGNGGKGGDCTVHFVAPGGGGAGGYSGNGGAGGNTSSAGTAGTGGAGGGGGGVSSYVAGGAGGGVGLYGEGANGTAGANGGGGGGGGSGGGAGGAGVGSVAGTAGLFGGAGGSVCYNNGSETSTSGGAGAVRIIWPGDARQFPATNTADV